jgi:hypothetical protein
MSKLKEPRAFCLSKSKRHAPEWDIFEDHSAVWNLPMSQTIFRIAREYDQMKKWAMYNNHREGK